MLRLWPSVKGFRAITTPLGAESGIADATVKQPVYNTRGLYQITFEFIYAK